MCGIIGYVGDEVEAGWLLQKLKCLEYRGYDSAGIAGESTFGFIRVRKSGELKNLEESLAVNIAFKTAIAHTRWATHGTSSEENAHPHISPIGNWAVVHNGIFENIFLLKESENLKPKGQTDTELFACHLEHKAPKNLREFIECFEGLKGTWALVAIQPKNNVMYLAKKSSPLYFAKGDNGAVLIASDPICFVGFSQTYYALEDGCFAEVKKGKVLVCTASGECIKLNPYKIEEGLDIEKGQACQHFMLKEIFEQPEALKRQVAIYKQKRSLEIFNKKEFSHFKKVVFVACGSAFHASLIGKIYFQQNLQISAEAIEASEFTYNKKLYPIKSTLFVFISQSGETADTLAVLKTIKKNGSKGLVLSNVEHSTLAQSADWFLPIYAGREVAVASTKAFICMLSALYMLAKHIKNSLKNTDYDYFSDILVVSDKILDFNYSEIEKLAKKLIKQKFAIFIGKGLSFISAREAALKLEEIGYMPVLALSSGELKHGYLALVKNKTPLICFSGIEENFVKNLNATMEAVSRGADVAVVSSEKVNSFKQVQIQKGEQELLPILEIVPMQYLSYLVAIKKGHNPDKPRNLAKSVTVQ